MYVELQTPYCSLSQAYGGISCAFYLFLHALHRLLHAHTTNTQEKKNVIPNCFRYTHTYNSTTTSERDR